MVTLTRPMGAGSVNRTSLAACIATATLAMGWSCTARADSAPVSDSGLAKPFQGRPWTIQDIVEVGRINSIAIREETRKVAYILMRPSVAAGRNLYALYTVDIGHPNVPHKLFEASYLADVTSHPRTDKWTVRADIGDGVQLYDVEDSGHTELLVRSATKALIGGSDGLQISPTEEPRQTGVLSYQWTSSGGALWYSCVRLRSLDQQREIVDQGIVYDDASMSGASERDVARSVQLLGTELHVVDGDLTSDRIVRFAPADAGGDFETFRRDAGSALWVDESQIQYRLRGTASGVERYLTERVDVNDGRIVRFRTESLSDIYYSVPTKEGLLTVRHSDHGANLVSLDARGTVIQDYGNVDYDRIGGGRGFWFDPRRNRMVASVQLASYDGLSFFGFDPTVTRKLSVPEHLSACVFTSDLEVGVCSRESLTRAPEIVALHTANGQIEELSQPNEQYKSITALHSVPARWKNRYGYTSSGYITFPRGYESGRRYPALVVTHTRDARNRFAYGGFQWEFPIQVFAERGYFILSVNEPEKPEALATPGHEGAAAVGVAREQFIEGYNPLATMEAAVGELVNSGVVDARKVGIAGFSRGSTIARFAMSHSRVFAAASSGDATWWDVGGYWEGVEYSRKLYNSLFGGAPFDPDAYPNYLKFSPSARARLFAGPILQQFTTASARNAVELDQLLREAGVPTELRLFSCEAHLLWNPRHRAFAMEQNLDWFDFWLLRKIDTSESKQSEYARWDQMKLRWESVASSKSGSKEFAAK